MLKVDLVTFHSRHYASRGLSAVFPSFKLLVFSRQSLSERITCYKGRPACFTIVQGGTLFWNISTAAEKDFAWVMVVTGTKFIYSAIVLFIVQKYYFSGVWDMSRNVAELPLRRAKPREAAEMPHDPVRDFLIYAFANYCCLIVGTPYLALFFDNDDAWMKKRVSYRNPRHPWRELIKEVITVGSVLHTINNDSRTTLGKLSPSVQTTSNSLNALRLSHKSLTCGYSLA